MARSKAIVRARTSVVDAASMRLLEYAISAFALFTAILIGFARGRNDQSKTRGDLGRRAREAESMSENKENQPIIVERGGGTTTVASSPWS